MKNEKNEKKNEIDKKRNYEIVKHNDLIQKSKYDLSTQEQKIILYLISKIKPGDEDFGFQEFEIKEFCKVCGIDDDNGGNYAALKKAVIDLSNKGFWVKVNTEYVSMRWIEKTRINTRSGIIKIKLDNDMKPYLLELKKHFTSYNLFYILAMKGKYSIRLYELLKSYEALGGCTFEIERLKTSLGASKYNAIADFRVWVVDAAIREINAFSDVSVTYELVKQGRKYHSIDFSITPKYNLDPLENLKVLENIKIRLDGG